MKTAIAVDASRREAEIDPGIYGHFIENMARCIYGGLLRNERPGRPQGPWKLREDLLAFVKEMRPSVLRWPGGLYADGYFWMDGVGPQEARPLRRNRYWSRYGPLTRVLDPNAFGSDEFMELVRDLKAVPYVNVNLGTGSPEVAARWVEYMNGDGSTTEGRRRARYGHLQPWGVRIWGIGNEMYGIWSFGHMKAREYARRYLEFRAAMEEVDSGLQFVAVGAEHYFSKKWNLEVLEEAGDRIDYLSVHVYLPGPERLLGVAAHRVRRRLSGMYASIVAAPLEVESRLRAVAGDIGAAAGGKGIRIAFDEWGLWWKPSQLLSPCWTLRDGLFTCGVFHALHRNAETVGMANAAQLVNVLGILKASGDRVYRSSIYYPFVMYSRLTGRYRLHTELSCETFSSARLGGIPAMGRVPVLDASATLSAEGRNLTLFVINRHISDEVAADIDVRGFTPAEKVEIQCYSGPDVNAVNSYGDDERVGLKSWSADAGDVLPRYRFPAHSATAIVLTRKGR